MRPTNETRSVGPRTRFAALAVVVAALLLGGAACSSSSEGTGGSDGSDASSAAPEDQRTSDAKVAEGLRKIEKTADGIAAAAGSDKAKATQLAGEIEPAWLPIEGTVKANDADTYLTFEDAFAQLENGAKDGDATLAAKGKAAVTKAVSDYLAKHPG